MTEKLIYTNSNNESVELSTLSVFHCNISRDVIGLSDVANEIKTIQSAGQDGEMLTGERIESKDIEIIGHIRTRDKVEIIAQKRRLNRVLNPHLHGRLTYFLGKQAKVINCNVSDAPQFKRKGLFEEFYIQFLCLNPFWREPTEAKSEIAMWLGRFEFPLNLSESWEVGERTKSLFANVRNDGDVDTGMRIVFRAIGELTNPKLLNINTQEYIKMNISMKSGDEITINTARGKKSVMLYRGGEVTNIFRSLDIDSSFMQLRVGDSIFRYSADTNENNLEVSIYHDNLYLGV